MFEDSTIIVVKPGRKITHDGETFVANEGEWIRKGHCVFLTPKQYQAMNSGRKRTTGTR